MTAGVRQDRRRSPRHAPGDVARGTLLRLRAGHEAQVINVSRHGILLESPTRLNPGQRCSLHWSGPGGPSGIGGVVVRAQVVCRDSLQRLVYRSAIDFSEACEIPWEPLTRAGNSLLAPTDVSVATVGSACPRRLAVSEE
jgi:hypothetical protein